MRRWVRGKQGTVETPDTVETPKLGVSTTHNHGGKNKNWKPGTLGIIINQYKRICTIQARKINPGFAWQPRFYDHIIRNQKSFQNISAYIKNNPGNWPEDRFFRKRSAEIKGYSYLGDPDMTKLDPIIAVKDIEKSAEWYEQVFHFKRKGEHLAVLYSEENKIVLCLHPWEMDNHPTMLNPGITPGNGIILYFKTNEMEKIRKNAKKAHAKIDEDIHTNPNPNKKEFSMWDPDGYYIIVTEYHEYEG